MRALSLILVFIFNINAFAQNKVNPDISLNTLFQLRQGTLGNSPTASSTNGFSLQEAELRLTSNIDTYFRGDVILAIEKNAEKTNPGEPEYLLEPEEVFVDTLNLPGVTVRMGKFYPYWGRTNQRHTHAFSFIDAPQTRTTIFGEEGFNETGLAISYLIPTSWYSEVVIQAVSAENKKVFGSDSQDDVAGVLFIKNFWEISETSTVELDLGYASGRDLSESTNNIYNISVFFKRKLENNKSFIWTTEYTLTEKLFDSSFVNTGRTSALSTWLQYQFKKRWWAQARYEVISNIAKNNIQDIRKSSALAAYIFSEFSALRLQYDILDDPKVNPSEERLTLQLNLTMGTHPAHNY